MFVLVHDTQYLFALLRWHLLRVARVCHRFVLIVLQSDVTQLTVRNVLNIYPFHFNLAFSLILGPHTRSGIIVQGGHHLCHPTKVSTSIYAEEQVQRTFALTFTVGSVHTFIAMLCTTPDTVLDGAMDIVLRITLYYEEPCTFRIHIKVVRIVLVGRT